MLGLLSIVFETDFGGVSVSNQFTTIYLGVCHITNWHLECQTQWTIPAGGVHGQSQKVVAHVRLELAFRSFLGSGACKV